MSQQSAVLFSYTLAGAGFSCTSDTKRLLIDFDCEWLKSNDVDTKMNVNITPRTIDGLVRQRELTVVAFLISYACVSIKYACVLLLIS